MRGARGVGRTWKCSQPPSVKRTQHGLSPVSGVRGVNMECAAAGNVGNGSKDQDRYVLIYIDILSSTGTDLALFALAFIIEFIC
jgi:hypothetical protein